MPDLTSVYVEIIKQKQEALPPADREKVLLNQSSKIHNKQLQQKTDIFTQECLSVNETINQLKHSIETIRPAYLASSSRAMRGSNGSVLGRYRAGLGALGTGGPAPVSLTEKERDDFDYEARMVIQKTMARIRHLEDLEQQRMARETARGAASITRKILALGGGNGVIDEEEQAGKTLALHRAGILWYLNEALKDVSAKHASQQEIRLSRQLEKTKNALHTVSDNDYPPVSRSGTPSIGGTGSALPFDGSSSSLATSSINFDTTTDDMPEALRELTPQQITALESENSALMDELELSLNKAKAAEKSLMEISQLQSSLAAHLSTQHDHIQNLLNESGQVHEDILQANKQLDNAKARNRRASKLIIISSLILAFLLLFYDYLLS